MQVIHLKKAWKIQLAECERPIKHWLKGWPERTLNAFFCHPTFLATSRRVLIPWRKHGNGTDQSQDKDSTQFPLYWLKAEFWAVRFPFIFHCFENGHEKWPWNSVPFPLCLKKYNFHVSSTFLHTESGNKRMGKSLNIQLIQVLYK